MAMRWGRGRIRARWHGRCMTALSSVRRDIRKLARPERADINKWFFKTGPGEYGAGDRFLGVTVPQLRVLAREYRDMPLKYVARLLQSPMARRTAARPAHHGWPVCPRQRAHAPDHPSALSPQHRLDQQLGSCRQLRAADRRGASRNARPASVAPARQIEIRVAAPHRDDRDLPLHPSARLQGCAGDRGAASSR